MSRVKPSFWLFLVNKSSFTPLSILALPFAILMLVYDAWLFSKLEAMSHFELSCFYMVIVFAILGFGIRIRDEWRKFQEFSLIFKNGLETIGEITVVYLAARKLYITIKFVYQQEERFTTKEIPLRSRNIKNLAVGQKVTLYVNPQYSTDIVFRDLYIYTL
jgi:hypothetical protein